ncbi:class I SAM-dependent methyltransferase [bacterium]|nr:class I SAM-dependent methyltransferase [bacterium]
MASDIRTFYDAQWAARPRAAAANNFLRIFDRAIRHSYSILGDIRGKKILEIGCGTGRQAVWFARRGAEVTAVDISEEALKSLRNQAAAENLPGIQILQMDAEHLQFPNDSFDVVYVNSVMMHLRHAAAFREFARVTKRGGQVVILEPMADNPVLILYRMAVSRWTPLRATFVTTRALDEARAHFSTLSRREFYFLALLAFPLGKLFHVWTPLDWISRIDDAILRILPGLGRFFWVSVADFRK